MSNHVRIEDPRQGNEILRRLHAMLHERFGIEHTTTQLEMQELTQIIPGGVGREAPPVVDNRGADSAHT